MQPDLTALADGQLHILQHSLGVDRFGQGKQYRNHFVTGEGSLDHPDCMALVGMGYMTRRQGSALTGEMDVFFVTDAGKAAVAEQSPKLTPAQKRYRAWLDADCGLSFIEYCKARAEAGAA